MLDQLSRTLEFQGRDMNASVADEARFMVRAAAEPVTPGESIKAQMRRSAQRLKMLNDRTLERRHRGAWYHEAGSWSAETFADLRARFFAWQSSEKRKNTDARARMADDFNSLASRLAVADPAFFRTHIEQLRLQADDLRRMAD